MSFQTGRTMAACVHSTPVVIWYWRLDLNVHQIWWKQNISKVHLWSAYHISKWKRDSHIRFDSVLQFHRYYTFISNLNFDHNMFPFIIKTFLLFLGSATCRFPNAWSQDGKDNNWALTQVLIYYAEEFHQNLIPGSLWRFFRQIVWFVSFYAFLKTISWKK